ncbi:MAG: putative molibdopterin-dependent oxidoreductase YjgC [Candidatus Poriferisodalaceae bacterium]|jgi:predicted molibdopterin-dependent oxidoreductase YjgC
MTAPVTPSGAAPRRKKRGQGRMNESNGVERLTTPMVRENGELRPASWDEAFDRAVEGFQRTLEAQGPDGIGMFSCSKSTNEMNYAAQKFMRTATRSNNLDSCNRT